MLQGNKKAIRIIKIFCCLGLCICIARNLPWDDMKIFRYQYCTIKNDILGEASEDCNLSDEVKQYFCAEGNIINDVSVYITGVIESDKKISIKILNKNSNIIFERDYPLNECGTDEWNLLEVNKSNIRKGEEYSMVLFSDCSTVKTILDMNSMAGKSLLGACSVNGKQIEKIAAVRIQFTYRYITAVGLLFPAVQFFLAALFVFVPCYGIFNYRKPKQFGSGEVKQAVLFTLYISVSLLLLFHPMDENRTGVKNFTREIGAGLITDYDVTRTISNFNLWFVFFAGLVLLSFTSVINWLGMEKTKRQIDAAGYLERMIILADVNLVFRCITYFSDASALENKFYYSSYVLALIICSFTLYIILRIDKYLGADAFLRGFFCCFAAGIPLAVLSSAEWESGKLLLSVQAGLVLFFIAVSKCRGQVVKKADEYGVLTAAAAVFSLFPFVTSFYIELVNILNQHNRFVGHPKKYYAAGIGMLIAICGAAAFMVFKQRLEVKAWKPWAYAWLVFGMACLSIQVPLTSVYQADIFESANYGVPISGFLDFGKIPIVESAGHHMMEGVWEGLVYALLNGDCKGAIFSPYSQYYLPVLAVLFFLLIRHIWDEDAALWVALLFPFMDFWSYFGWGMLICLSAAVFVKKNSYAGAFGIWISSAWCALYRADLGYAFGIACIAAMIIYITADKNWKALKKLAVSLGITGAAGAAIWTGMCFWKGIHPVMRLAEFLKLFDAGINWTYNTIGNNADTVYAWSYLFIPLAMVFSLLIIVFCKKFRERNGSERWMILLVLGLAYFGNFSRGLTRHSLNEMNTTIVIWTAYIYLSYFVSCFFLRKGLFLPVFTGFILFNTLFVQKENFVSVPIADQAASKAGIYTQTWTLEEFAEEETSSGEEWNICWEELSRSKKKVERVSWDASLEETVNAYSYFIESFLDDDDTFIDFIYHSFLYAALGRECPVYAAQSPTMLSGELTQECFIDEVEKKLENVPIALMPNASGNHADMDGIMLNFKYYKVAEFIYKHYRPLCEYGNFSIWCLNDRYGEMRAEFEQIRMQTDMLKKMMRLDGFHVQNCTLVKNEKKQTLILKANGKDPQLCEIQEALDLEKFFGRNVEVKMDYQTSSGGIMQIFYTTEEGEEYSEEKSFSANVSGSGTVKCCLPITQFTRLRLDIPEESCFEIKELELSVGSLIDWGYDGPMDGSIMHNYSLDQLPLIWAEKDEKNAVQNNVISKAEETGSVYVFDTDELADNENGAYLLIRAFMEKMPEQQVPAVIKLGRYENGKFTEKCRYNITLKEGSHSYLIRVSSDYYWHLNEINAVGIEHEGRAGSTEVKILEGD